MVKNEQSNGVNRTGKQSFLSRFHRSLTYFSDPSNTLLGQTDQSINPSKNPLFSLPELPPGAGSSFAYADHIRSMAVCGGN